MEYSRGKGAEDIQYRLPSRTLADSDVSVVLLDLFPNGRTAWNSHPGFETLIPIQGAVRVVLREEGKDDRHGAAATRGALVV